MNQVDSSSQGAAKTSASRALRELLKVSGEPIPVKAFVSLLSMEARDTLSDLTPEQNPRLCCFDIVTPPSWAARTICRRCRNLNEILQGEARRL